MKKNHSHCRDGAGIDQPHCRTGCVCQRKERRGHCSPRFLFPCASCCCALDFAKIPIICRCRGGNSRGRDASIRGSPERGVPAFCSALLLFHPSNLQLFCSALLVVQLFAGFLQAPADGTAASGAGFCRTCCCPALVGPFRRAKTCDDHAGEARCHGWKIDTVPNARRP
jgi:hypothetical protein